MEDYGNVVITLLQLYEKLGRWNSMKYDFKHDNNDIYLEL